MHRTSNKAVFFIICTENILLMQIFLISIHYVWYAYLIAKYFRVQYGCPVTISLPTADGDCDIVRCRWATKPEASSIAYLLPNANLDKVE